MAHTRHEIDMLRGPLYRNLIVYSLPLIASGELQLLYNAADVIVVGRWAGSQSLAAVGSCGALMNLFVNLFLGLSVGTSVVVAQRIGAQRYAEVSRSVSTAITVSGIGGVLIGALGIALARITLQLMDSPADIIDRATLYLRICFGGVPAVMVYNFGAAVLRAAGDTRRPLYFLSISGFINAALNLVFVIVFHMDVAGVGIATIFSQYVSAVLVVRCLVRSHECYRFDIRRIRIHGGDLLQMMRVGLPAGIQSTLFSVSNVIIQSTVNSFGSTVIAGNSASGNLEGFVSTANNSLSQAALTFTGQNYGARQYRRTGQVLKSCLVLVCVIGVPLGTLFYLLRAPLLSIYAPGQQEVIDVGCLRMTIMCLTYFVCGMMDTTAGCLRGLGYSMAPMIVSLMGICGMRLVWIAAVFPLQPTLQCLYISYPISWVLTLLVHISCYLIIHRHLPPDGQPVPKKGKVAAV